MAREAREEGRGGRKGRKGGEEGEVEEKKRRKEEGKIMDGRYEEKKGNGIRERELALYVGLMQYAICTH